jgi:hypothetical protein
MRVLAIDPGPTQSAWCLYNAAGGVLTARKDGNDALLYQLKRRSSQVDAQHLCVEMVASYGMPVGREVFETCVWIGRFIEAWGEDWSLLPRLDVKLHLCHDSRAKDANIRRALLDRFGPPGTKKAPGATYGLTGDCWSALAVAVTCMETRLEETR